MVKFFWGWKERHGVLPTGDGETSLLKLLLTLDEQKSVTLYAQTHHRKHS